MATKDWNGFKKNGDTYIPNDSVARDAVDTITDGASINSFSDVETALTGKVDKVNGKGLSANDYTNADKAKVDGAFPRSEQAVLGAKNFISAKAESATVDTVSFTNNSEGTITANTSEATTQRTYVRAWRGTLKKGRYIFNGCPSGGNNTNGYYMRFQTPSQQFDDVGNGVEIVIDDNNVAQTWSIFIVFEVAGLTADNLVFKPQLRLATDTDPTYAPYAMTNRELTEKKANEICTTGSHSIIMVVPCIIPSNGHAPEFFIPWNNPQKKQPTFNNFKAYDRTGGAWTELTQTSTPNIQMVEENGIYVNLLLTNELTSNSEKMLRVTGDLVFS